MPDASNTGRVLTIGHSNHERSHFLQLVSRHSVEVIADVRSWPHSRHVPWADSEVLPTALREVGCGYTFLGEELGGRPDEAEFYDAGGRVLYGRVAKSELFKSGLARLREGLAKYRVALMCSEENPAHCHRRLLVAKVLIEEGVDVVHIRGDGRLETEPGIDPPGGFQLFDDEDSWWTSTQSVSHRQRPKTSSPV
jgi:uncharacterized protein (DUF488 family)